MLIYLATEIPFGSMLYVLISFALLLFVVNKFAHKPISDIINKRQQQIDDDLENAAKAKADAEKQQQATNEQLSQAKVQANQIIEDARNSASKQSDEILTSARNKAQVLQAQAEDDAAKIKSDALMSAKNQVADLSVDIASQLLSHKIDASDQSQLIDQFIDGVLDAPISSTAKKDK